MANAKQCDRCGKFYNYETIASRVHKCNGSEEFISSIGGAYWEADLCQDCQVSLEKWWESKDG